MTITTSVTTWVWVLDDIYKKRNDANWAVGASPAPPAPTSKTDMWIPGGYNYVGPGPVGYVSNVSRITFSTDTSTSTPKGPMAYTGAQLPLAGNITDFWSGAFYNGSSISTIQRVTFSTDTATASIRGTDPAGTYESRGMGNNTTDGWFTGGNNAPQNHTTRMVFANDLVTQTLKGALSQYLNSPGCTANTTDGWAATGLNNPAYRSWSNRITFANDTVTAPRKGDLEIDAGQRAATGNMTDGWWTGGYRGQFATPVYTNTGRLNFATDTATGVPKGNANVERANHAASSNLSYCWFAGGGDVSGNLVSSTERLTMATDTAVMTPRGPLDRISQANNGGVANG